MPSPLDSNVAKAQDVLCFGWPLPYVVWLASKPLPLCKAQRTTGRCQVSFSSGGWGVAAWHQFRGFQWFHGVSALRTNFISHLFRRTNDLNFFSRPSDAKEQEALKQLLSVMPSQRSIAASNSLLEYVCYCLLYPPQALNFFKCQTALQL